MTFAVRVDASDPTPPYEQLRRQIAEAIGSGVLPVGTQLPTVRQLAGDLGVATGTVMRAYAELEAANLVRTARGAGTRVAAVATLSPNDQQTRLKALAGTFVGTARLLGVDDDQITLAVERSLGIRAS
ncbi:MAG: GntR family transcriptional regulator [Propionibacteriaceae bacterium]|nr:GntR family transcriptional regulator [Propionibacteriaceae bacterium]